MLTFFYPPYTVTAVVKDSPPNTNLIYLYRPNPSRIFPTVV